jgi:DNA-binding LacI/PurR family transcriptional regulator
VLEEILDYQVDGIIMASVALSSELTARCQAAGVPVMLFNRAQDDAGISAVTSDNRAGGRAVARFLLDGGHKRFGHIAGWEGASTQRDREQGFADGLGEAGIDRYDREVGNFQIDEARAAARRMFDRPDRPDAVFAANDHMAFAVMDVLRYELGLSVPGDVSVVGFDDVPPASWPAYDLTTVRQRANLMVERTVATLLKMIEQPGARAEQHVLPAPLVVRGSARIPEGWDT